MIELMVQFIGATAYTFSFLGCPVTDIKVTDYSCHGGDTCSYIQVSNAEVCGEPGVQRVEVPSAAVDVHVSANGEYKGKVTRHVVYIPALHGGF